MAAGGLDDDDEITGINITPMVDIILVLLVIFMVTTTTISNVEGLEVQQATCQATSVWRGVNNYVEQNGVDLIVMATHKNGLLERLFGTKADGIMHHAKVPVLSMPPKD